MSPYGREDAPPPFTAAELDGIDAAPDELLAVGRVARELEAAAERGGVRPSADFADRVMRSIAAEPSPAPVWAAGVAVRRHSLGGLVASVRDAVRVGFGAGFPLAVRAQALALVLLVTAVFATGSGMATVGAVHLLGGNHLPSVADPTTQPATPEPPASPEGSLDPAGVSGSPDPSEPSEPSASDHPDPSGSETPGESPEPTDRPGGNGGSGQGGNGGGPGHAGATVSPAPVASPEPTEGDHGGHGGGPGGSGDPGASPRPSDTPVPTDTPQPTPAQFILPTPKPTARP